MSDCFARLMSTLCIADEKLMCKRYVFVVKIFWGYSHIHVDGSRPCKFTWSRRATRNKIQCLPIRNDWITKTIRRVSWLANVFTLVHCVCRFCLNYNADIIIILHTPCQIRWKQGELSYIFREFPQQNRYTNPKSMSSRTKRNVIIVKSRCSPLLSILSRIFGIAWLHVRLMNHRVLIYHVILICKVHIFVVKIFWKYSRIHTHRQFASVQSMLLILSDNTE